MDQGLGPTHQTDHPYVHMVHLDKALYIYVERERTGKHTWECCAPTPAAAPLGPLKTIGTFI